MDCYLVVVSQCRAEELGFAEPTHVQREALPILLSGRDCILHAQVNHLPLN